MRHYLLPMHNNNNNNNIDVETIRPEIVVVCQSAHLFEVISSTTHFSISNVFQLN